MRKTDKHVPGKDQKGDPQEGDKQAGRFNCLEFHSMVLKKNPDDPGADYPVNPKYKQENEIVKIGGKIWEFVFTGQLVAEHNGNNTGEQ